MRSLWPAILVVPAAAGAWALWPISPPPVRGDPVTDQRADDAALAVAALDTAAFRAPLWVAPPPQPAPPPAATAQPPPPLRLQLLAVVREGDQHRAMLYDPDSDRIVLIGSGERVRDGTVERVTSRGVEIRSAAGLRTLALRPDQGAQP